MKFEEIIEEMRKQEDELNLVVLAQKTQQALILQKICGIWGKVRIKRIERGECRARNYKDQWQWLWRQVRFDVKEIADMIGYRGDKMRDYVDILINMSLIYPDGTISDVARKALESILRDALNL